MKPIPEVLFRKLCYLFHRGFIESRLLAVQKQMEQARDLADTFEIMPGYLPEWNEESLDLIRSHLHTYQNKYGASSFDYLAVLEMDNERFSEVLSKW